MMGLIIKYALTSALVVLIAELAKRSDKLGSLIAALPIVTLLVMTWLFLDKQPAEKIINHAKYTFWYVLPTLPMFLLFGAWFNRFGFWWALVLCALLTMGLFAVLAFILRYFNIDIW